jgi:integrase
VKPALKYSTKQHYEYVLNFHLYPEYGDTQLRLISRDMVQRFLFKKFQDLSWKTVKHIRTVFGTVFKAAQDADLVSDNPVLKTRLPRQGQRSEKPVIQPEDIRNLLENLPEPSRSIAGLLVYTGMRIGEALALRWRDVDLESGKIRIRERFEFGRQFTKDISTNLRPSAVIELFRLALRASRFSQLVCPKYRIRML